MEDGGCEEARVPVLTSYILPPPFFSMHLKPGKYVHYKGNFYEVLGVALHSETMEELVVYRALYGERGLWARPKAMFCETVNVAGKTVPRFRYLGEETT